MCVRACRGCLRFDACLRQLSSCAVVEWSAPAGATEEEVSALEYALEIADPADDLFGPGGAGRGGKKGKGKALVPLPVYRVVYRGRFASYTVSPALNIVFQLCCLSRPWVRCSGGGPSIRRLLLRARVCGQWWVLSRTVQPPGRFSRRMLVTAVCAGSYSDAVAFTTPSAPPAEPSLVSAHVHRAAG